MIELDKNFWTSRYRSGKLGWDAGSITTPLKNYFDQLTNKSLKILIPGCGNGYEAEYLCNKGFNVTVVDISDLPLERLRKRCSNSSSLELIEGDFFELTGKYDLIVEQTFFCAIDPTLRTEYAKKAHDLLTSGGKLVGVLFNIPLYEDRPPFGGNSVEYSGYFEPYFSFNVFEECYNSIKPRQGNELFINLVKK